MTKLMHLGLALSLLGVAAAAPAMAEQPVEHDVRIVVGDLNFAQPGDVAKFDARVAVAGRRLCETGHWSEMLKVRACYRAVAQEAAAKLSESQRQTLAATRAGAQQKKLGLG